MADVLNVTDADFDEQVIQSDVPVLVDFSATWCGPCKQLTPIVEALASEYSGRLKVAAVDVDQARDTATRFGIMSVPTLLFFRGGEQADEVVGVQTKAALKERIEKIIG